MSSTKAFDIFMRYVYTTEDSLYQILYDKCYRPEVYKLKTQKIAAGSGQQVDLARFETAKEPGAISFIEMRFLEQINSTRAGLLQKFPLFILMGTSVFLARRLNRVHTQLLTHGQYLRIDTSGKKIYNSLAIVGMIAVMLNFASAFAGFLLCSVQYVRCVKRRYFEPIEFEKELIGQYLDDIRKYRDFK